MDKNKVLAEAILNACGGVKNIGVANHCATRLRLTLNDKSKADQEKIKKIPGVMGLVTRGDEYQIVIGVDVGNVYNDFVKLGNFEKGGKVKGDGKKNLLGRIIDFISGTFVPVLPILVAAGLVSAVLNICVTFFGLSTETGTYTVLNAVNNAGFYFLPVFIGYSAARKIGINPMMGAYLGAILVHSSIDGAAGLDFLGIPITQANYNTSVIPIILGVLFMAVIDKGADRIIPKEIKFFAKPLLVILIVTPVTLIALGPLGAILGNYVATALIFINTKLGWLSVGLIGALTPVLVMTGMNQALFPVVFASMAEYGYDAFVMTGMLAANVAIGAAALSVSVKSKNTEVKALSFSSGLTGVLGITEPSIYGVLLRFKRPFIGAVIGGGVGGLFAGIMQVKQYAVVSPGIAALPTFIPTDGSGNMTNFYLAALTIVISVAVSFIATWLLGFEDVTADQETARTSLPDETIKGQAQAGIGTITSPLKGEVRQLSEVEDEAFSSGILGSGVAILPAEGKLVAPADGEITAFLPAGHAIGIKTVFGAEILIHVGMDTVELNGKYFTKKVNQGDKVIKGQELLEFDLNAIKAAGYSVLTPVVVTNRDDYTDLIFETGKDVGYNEELIKVR